MTTWDDVAARLADELATLEDQAFVVVRTPPGPPTPRGRLRRPGSPAATPQVQVLRQGDLVRGEVVGTTAVGGPLVLPQGAHDVVRSLGWLLPDERGPDGVRPLGNRHYWYAVQVGDTARLASLAAGALAALGARPDELTWLRET